MACSTYLKKLEFKKLSPSHSLEFLDYILEHGSNLQSEVLETVKELKEGFEKEVLETIKILKGGFEK